MKNILTLLVFILVSQINFAQEFDVNLQLRPRFEFRNGYKNLLSENQDATSFVSQRSRLNLDFKNEALQFKFSLQNIRVWGDVPLLSTSDKNGVAIFEAYGDYQLNKKFRFRIGRQVLSYDNQRILGEVDWAQQGQSHDAALVTWLPKERQRLDLGFALNSDKENLFEVPYEVNNYKSMQFAWYHIKFTSAELSLLFLNTGYEFENPSAVRETQYLQTFGSYFKFDKNNWFGDAAAYGQVGKRNDATTEAWYAAANLNYKISEILKIGLGAEYLSGKDMDDSSSKLKSFTPLFGTNHGFNGSMDYFYVGNHQNSVGLADLFGKFTYSPGKLDVSAIAHIFSSAANVIDENNEKRSKYLGTEIDLKGSYKIRKDMALSLGYSQMFGEPGLEILKGGDASRIQNWAWLAISFHPRLFSMTK